MSVRFIAHVFIFIVHGSRFHVHVHATGILSRGPLPFYTADATDGTALPLYH